MTTRENYFFFSLLLIIFSFGIFSYTKTETLISETENRKLTTFPHFTIESFFSNTFQDRFESAFSDQFISSEQIRLNQSAFMSGISVVDPSTVCSGHYLELRNSPDRHRATFDCDEYILFSPERPSEEQTNIITDNIAKYNHANTITDAYYYFVNDSSVYDFENEDKIVDYPAILRQNLSGDYHLGSFEVANYDEFKQNFYKTDHHWDYRGSYKGYKDIIKLLGAGKPYTPVSVGTNHEDSFGSHARITKNFDYPEEFSYFNFNLPDHSVTLDGVPGTYGNADDYKKHNYEYDKTTNYYAYFYGDDNGEIVYDYHQANKPNLLIISNSFSNAVNELIASHFNKTFIVDLRHYKIIYGKDFELSDYLKENSIDKTLFLMNPMFFYSVELNQGLES